MKYSLDDLIYLMSRLRDPETGCPWDLAQDFESITPSTVEEVYELVDAIRSGDKDQTREELGDLLFQIIFYTQLASETDDYSFDDIVHAITEKLVRRHPHVFPDGELRAHFDGEVDVTAVKQQWEAIKEQERKVKNQHKILDDIPLALPALSRAQKIQKRVSRVGFDWPDAASAVEKIHEELAELKQAISEEDEKAFAEELGDLLFSCVNVARHLKLDAETLLDQSNRKFESRFRLVESLLEQQGKSAQTATLLEMDELWEEAKRTRQSRG